MIAGRLTGTLDGRPIEVIAEGDSICLRFESLVAAWRSRRAARGGDRLLAALRVVGVSASVRLGDSFTLPVSPEPHWAIRPWLSGGTDST